jgi:hypothetical protein
MPISMSGPSPCDLLPLVFDGYNARNTMLSDFVEVLKKHPRLRASQTQAE